MSADSDWILPLKKEHPTLSDRHIDIIKNMIDGFTKNIDAQQLRFDFLNKNEFDYLSARLISHHAASGNHLKKENFEHALEAIFKLEGKAVTPSTDPTRRGADIIVDALRISLKTFSKKSKNLDVVDVSKFAECRWLREPLQKRDANVICAKMKVAINTHLAEYQKIIMFANSRDGKIITYKMIEIPKEIFALANNLTPTDVALCLSKGNQTITMPLVRNGQKVAVLSLDGSVEKLRFLSIKVSECLVHAIWNVELP